MHDWLADRAAATPAAEGLVNAATGNAWDYATLDETVEEMAGRLVAAGVEEGDHLGAVLGTCVEHVCLVHAAMRLGAVLVPLSPRFTSPELGERLERADVSAVVCDADAEQTVVEADPDLPTVTVDDPQWEGVTSLGDLEPAAFTPAEWGRDDPQLLLFTSGTTGTPKGVVLTMGNLLASAVASAFRLGVDPADRWLVPLSLHHMGGIAPVLRSTLYGTTVVVREEFDPGGTVDDVLAHDVTGVSLVPTMLRKMLSARGTLPDSLRFVLVGGAPCPRELVERCRDFRVPVCPTYGMTETASQVATAMPDQCDDDPDTVGHPLLWTTVTVVDEDGDPLPRGETGELVVDGPTVTPGYYDDPEATEAAFGEYGLHTGDAGVRAESGLLYVQNRLDDRILTGGENVDPGEVTDAIRSHPDVEDAVVVGLPDDEWGERVAALVVPRNGDLTPGDVEAYCRERLAGYKLPRTLGFADELPRTVSGTVERAAVKERLLSDAAAAIEHAEPGAELPPGDADPVPDDADIDAADGDDDDAGDEAGDDGAGDGDEDAADAGEEGADDEDTDDDPEGSAADPDRPDAGPATATGGQGEADGGTVDDDPDDDSTDDDTDDPTDADTDHTAGDDDP